MSHPSSVAYPTESIRPVRILSFSRIAIAWFSVIFTVLDRSHAAAEANPSTIALQLMIVGQSIPASISVDISDSPCIRDLLYASGLTQTLLKQVEWAAYHDAPLGS